MSETVRYNDLRVQGQGIPWTTWGIVTPHSKDSIKDPGYFSKVHDLVYTGDFIEVLSQNKETEEQILFRFYVELADPKKAVVIANLLTQRVLVKAKKGAKKGSE